MIEKIPQLHRFELISQLLCFCPNFACVCVLAVYTCVCYRKLQGVCVWAPEESGPWPGLPDTGGKAHCVFNTETSRAHSKTQTET